MTRSNGFDSFGLANVAVWILVFLVFPIRPADAEQTGLSYAKKRVLKLRISYNDHSGIVKSGTGLVLTKNGYVLTAKHVIPRVYLKFLEDKLQWHHFRVRGRFSGKDSTWKPLEIAAVNAEHDVLLLKLPSLDEDEYPFFSISGKRDVESDDLFSAGFPQKSQSLDPEYNLSSSCKLDDPVCSLSKKMEDGKSGSPILWHDKQTVVGLLLKTSSEAAYAKSEFQHIGGVTNWLNNEIPNVDVREIHGGDIRFSARLGFEMAFSPYEYSSPAGLNVEDEFEDSFVGALSGGFFVETPRIELRRNGELLAPIRFFAHLGGAGLFTNTGGVQDSLGSRARVRNSERLRVGGGLLLDYESWRVEFPVLYTQTHARLEQSQPAPLTSSKRHIETEAVEFGVNILVPLEFTRKQVAIEVGAYGSFPQGNHIGVSDLRVQPKNSVAGFIGVRTQIGKLPWKGFR